MASSTTAAFIHSKSIKEAMKAEAESVLENLSTQAAAYAIYCLALGFQRQSEYSPMSASQAFTAAAIWGSIATVSAVAGRAVAGPACRGEWRGWGRGCGGGWGWRRGGGGGGAGGGAGRR